MNRKRLTWAVAAAAALITAWASGSLKAQQPGFKRVELQRHDVGAGREVVQVRAEFEPGASVGSHTHPGEEFGYLLEGNLEVEVAGKPGTALKPGDTFFFPAGTAHAAKNVGKTRAAVLATYLVEKGKPLSTMVATSAAAPK